MNAVVQQILDSGTNEDAEKEVDGTTRVIDLTDEESAKKVQNLAKIPVDTNMLQKILETVEKQGSVFACSNLLSFHQPRGPLKPARLLKQQPSVGSANVHIVFSQQSNLALSVIFVEAFLIRIFTDGECVDLV